MAKNKRVLAVCFSQTGQTRDALNAFLGPFVDDPSVDLILEFISSEAYPFPWRPGRFFAEMICCFEKSQCSVELTPKALTSEPDLIILAYPVWFLSPPPPVTHVLRSRDARRLLRGRPVITLTTCRNMWATAHACVRHMLNEAGATFIDNVVLADRSNLVASLIATPLWMLTGQRGPFFFGLLPKAGIASADIRSTRSFGLAIIEKLAVDGSFGELPPGGLGAAPLNERLLGPEIAARRAFEIFASFMAVIPDPATRRLATSILLPPFLVVLIVFGLPAVLMLDAALPRAALIRRRQLMAMNGGE